MSEHADNCDWNTDQYPWECTCGVIPRKEEMEKLAAQINADLTLIMWDLLQ